MQLILNQVVPGTWYFAPNHTPPDRLQVVVAQKSSSEWLSGEVITGDWLFGYRLESVETYSCAWMLPVLPSDGFYFAANQESGMTADELQRAWEDSQL